MSPKRIFILDGHPADESLSRSLSQRYADAARAAGHDVRLTHLHDLTFDPDFEYGGYTHHKPLEPQLETFLQDVEWSQHLVVTTPMWWGGLPAKLKGLFDRTFLPGRTFDTRVKPGKMPKPMLTGRTARVIMTSDTPPLIMRLIYRNAILWQLRSQILGFVGFKPTRITYLSGATHPKPGMVVRWLDQVQKIGTQGV